jgi:hypothetical protein
VKRGIAMRIAKLERRLGKGRGEMFVLALPEGMNCDAALAALGLTPSAADLVVIFPGSCNETEPRLLNRCRLVR